MFGSQKFRDQDFQEMCCTGKVNKKKNSYLDACFNHPPQPFLFRDDLNSPSVHRYTDFTAPSRQPTRKPQDRIDPDFSEELTLEVIERGSAVHCVFWVQADGVEWMEDGESWVKLLPSMKLTVAT